MTDKQVMAKWTKITDPKKALSEIVKGSHMFYGDSYYSDLIDALMAMATRLSEPEKRSANV